LSAKVLSNFIFLRENPMSFGKKDNAHTENSSSVSSSGSSSRHSSGSNGVEAFLGQGSKVNGTLTFSGPAELNGLVEGELHAKEKLTIGESAVINARIVGGEILVKGTVNGDISAKTLSLKRPAKINGNITSSNLSIEEGVIFEGKCSMSQSSESKSSPSMKPGLASKAGAPA